MDLIITSGNVAFDESKVTASKFSHKECKEEAFIKTRGHFLPLPFLFSHFYGRESPLFIVVYNLYPISFFVKHFWLFL